MKNLFNGILRSQAYLISLLPWWIIYLISDLVYYLMAYIFRYRSQVIDSNLHHSFPEKTAWERKMIKKRYYRHLADLLVEVVKLQTISAAEVERRVVVPNADLIRSYFEQGRSVIGVLGHYGNWEMAALRYSQLFDQPRLIVYKPLSNEKVDTLVKQVRSRFGATLIAMKETFRKLLSLRDTPSITVMVSDQVPPKTPGQSFFRFLNQQTAVFSGVEKLAKVTDSVVVFCDIRKLARGRYSCTFVPLHTEPRLTGADELTKIHVAYLEKVIRQEPAYWLWSHRRWKYGA